MKAWRESRDLTQEKLVVQLAELAEYHISPGQLSRIETGKQGYGQDLLEALATVYGCDPADIIRRDPTQPESPKSILDTLRPVDRDRFVRMIEAYKDEEGTGTDG